MFAAQFILIGTFVLGLSTAYVIVEQLHNVERVDNIGKIDFSYTGKNVTELNQFAGYVGVLEVLDHSLIPTDWKSIQFNLKLRSNATVYSVEMVQSSGRYTYSTSPQELFHHMRADYDARRFTLTITLREEHVGFALWDIRVDHNVTITPKQVHIVDRSLVNPNSLTTTYLVKHSANGDRASMNFSLEDNDSSKGYCFSITTSRLHTPIDVHVNVFGVSSKLTQFSPNRLQNELCLSSYFYVRQLGRFDISFTFPGNVSSEDDLAINLISGRIDKAYVPIKKVQPSYMNKLVREDNPGWWYNNPKLFDYSVVASCKTPLYVCDIVANCFLYDRKQIDHLNVIVYNFTLPEQYKPLLSHSPLVRVHCEDPDFVIYRSTSYFSASKTALNRIQSYLLTSFPKLQLNTSDESISYQLQVPRLTRIPLSIPIELIDHRAQSILVNIIPLNGIENRVNLNGVYLNASDMGHIRDTQNDKYILTTGDYVQVEPWKMTNDVRFGIEFVVERIGGDKVVEHDLVGVHIEISVEGFKRSFGGFGRIPEFEEENCRKGPTYGDLDCLYDEYQCPEYYFKYDPVKKTCTRTDVPMHK